LVNNSSRDERKILRTYKIFDSRRLTLVATLAAVYALGSFLPGFPMIGFQGAEIDIVRALEMGYGFVLGPIFGPITAFLGAIVGKVLQGSGFGLFFTPLAPVSAFMAATLSRRYVFRIRGWILASVILAILIVGWYGTDAGRTVPQYPFMHLIGLGIILVLRGRLSGYLQSEDKSKLSIGVALCSFPSTIAGHMLGNLIFMSLVKTDPLFFIGILPLSVSERVALTLLSTAIATPLLLIVRNLFPGLVEEE